MEIITILWIVIAVLFMLLVLVFLFFIYYWWRFKRAYIRNFDIFIDKANRYELIPSETSSKEKFERKDGSYIRTKECSLMSKQGKVLYIYSIGHPTPLKIEFKKSDWIDSESARAIFNNNTLQKIASPSNQKQDMMIGIMLLCTVISAVISAAIALKIFGVLK